MRHVLTLALLLAFAAPVRADSPVDKAKAHLALAERHFAAQQYDKAAAELKEAYVLDPKPEYLYALAQALRLSGDCPAAVRAYTQYLKTHPAEAEASKARANIERCKSEPTQPLPVAPAPSPEPPPPPAPSPAVAPPLRVAPLPADDRTRSGWTRDYLGHALVGSGVVLGVAGSLLYVGGGSTIDSINHAPSYDVYVMRRGDLDGAQLRQRVGISGIVIGGLLVISGIAHYAMRGDGDAAVVSASVGRDHAMLVLGGRL